MSTDDQPITSKDFKLLIEEIKKVNASVKKIPTQKGGGGVVESIAGTVKSRFDDIKKRFSNPVEKVADAVKAPFNKISSGIESVGEVVMQPFQAFKDVTQGFKNIFSKNETERQIELLEGILESVETLNSNFETNTNREQNKDLIKLEQTREQQSTFKSIADNIKKGGLDAGGRGVRRKGKPGTGGGGLGVNIISDFFLAATVSQRGIGDFLKTTGKNLVTALNSTLSGFGKFFRGTLSLGKDLFASVVKGQKGLPLRKQAIKDKLSFLSPVTRRVKGAFSAVKSGARGLKERFFPSEIQEEFEGEEFSLSGDGKRGRKTRSDKGIKRGSYKESAEIRAEQEKLQGKMDFESPRVDKKETGTELIVRSNQEIVEAVKSNTNSIIKALTGNDLRRAETEKERDKTFSDIADSLENIEEGGGNNINVTGADGEGGAGGGLFGTALDLAGDYAIGKGIEKGLKGAKGGKGGKGGILKGIGNFLGKTRAGRIILTAGTLFGASKFFGGKGNKPPTPTTSSPFKGVTTGPPTTPSGNVKPNVKPSTIGNVVESAKNNLTQANQKGLENAKNITNAPGSSVSNVKPNVKKPGFFSRALKAVNPMEKIRNATKALKTAIPGVLKRIPLVGTVVEGIFLDQRIKEVLEDPEISEEEKKRVVGAEFIKSLTGPAGAALAMAAVTAATGGVGFLASAVTGVAGYSAGRFIGEVLASILPAEKIGGSIIDAFYGKLKTKKGDTIDLSAPSDLPDPMRVETPVQKITEFAKGGAGDLATIDFVQEKYGIQFPGASKNAQGLTQYKGSGAAIEAAQDLMRKNPNATGTQMLQTIESANQAAADLRMRNQQYATAGGERGNIINAPQSTQQNITNNIIENNHIDRTMGSFGLVSPDF